MQLQEQEIIEKTQNLGSDFLSVKRPQVSSYSGKTKCKIESVIFWNILEKKIKLYLLHFPCSNILEHTTL